MSNQAQAPRSMWTGTLSFGMVAVPVKLYTAASEHNVAFRQVHDADGAPINYRRFCSLDGEEVPYEHIVKGLESGGDMLVFTDDDMASLPVPSVKAVEVLHFCDETEIDPILFHKSYYMKPDKGGERAYALLRGALDEAGAVAVTMVALRQREALAVVRTSGAQLILTTLMWPDEIRDPVVTEEPPADPEQARMAAALVRALTKRFDPAEHQDAYEAAVLQMAEDKRAGSDVILVPAPAKQALPDLTSALRDSIASVTPEDLEKAGKTLIQGHDSKKKRR